MNRESATAVKIRLIVQFLEYLSIEHSDNKIIGLVTIGDYTKECCLRLSITIDSNTYIR